MNLLPLLMRVRPARLGVFLGRILGIRRRPHTMPAGFSMHLDPLTMLGFNALKGAYEPMLTRVVQHLMKDGGTFVDVGANEGYFSLVAATACASARVESFEPQHDVCDILRANLQLNSLTNVTLHEVALTDRDGSVEIAPAFHSGATRLADLPGSGASRRTVPAKRLDGLLHEPIRLAKLDCEGAELRVLQGATRLLESGLIEYLSVDYHPAIVGEAGAAAVDGLLRSSGYLCTSVDGLWLYHRPGGAAALAGLGQLRDVAPLVAPTY